MAFIFTITTPIGIAVGIGIASTYNANSTNALITQGIFDAVSTGHPLVPTRSINAQYMLCGCIYGSRSVLSTALYRSDPLQDVCICPVNDDG